MGLAKAWVCALAMTLAACESVPDLTFGEDDAAADGGDASDAAQTSDANATDTAAPDTSDGATCSPLAGSCKNDHDCCAGKCGSVGGGQKICGP